MDSGSPQSSDAGPSTTTRSSHKSSAAALPALPPVLPFVAEDALDADIAALQEDHHLMLQALDARWLPAAAALARHQGIITAVQTQRSLRRVAAAIVGSDDDLRNADPSEAGALLGGALPPSRPVHALPLLQAAQGAAAAARAELCPMDDTSTKGDEAQGGASLLQRTYVDPAAVAESAAGCRVMDAVPSALLTAAGLRALKADRPAALRHAEHRIAVADAHTAALKAWGQRLGRRTANVSTRLARQEPGNEWRATAAGCVGEAQRRVSELLAQHSGAEGGRQRDAEVAQAEEETARLRAEGAVLQARLAAEHERRRAAQAQLAAMLDDVDAMSAEIHAVRTAAPATTEARDTALAAVADPELRHRLAALISGPSCEAAPEPWTTPTRAPAPIAPEESHETFSTAELEKVEFRATPALTPALSRHPSAHRLPDDGTGGEEREDEEVTEAAVLRNFAAAMAQLEADREAELAAMAQGTAEAEERFKAAVQKRAEVRARIQAEVAADPLAARAAQLRAELAGLQR